jgi:Flp pilus assembly protein TadD
MLAPGHEKAFYRAVQAYLRGDADEAAELFRESAAKDTKDKALSDDFFAGLVCAQAGDDDEAIQLLEKGGCPDRRGTSAAILGVDGQTVTGSRTS